MLRIALLLVLVMLSASQSHAQSRRGGEPEEKKIYTENAKRMLERFAVEEAKDKIVPLTDQEMKDFKELTRKVDSYMYDQPETLVINNKVIPYDLSKRDPIVIKLGHSYTSTIVMTDAQGNPWSFDTLSNLSNENVASLVKEPANPSHMLSIRPKVTSGQTNLPIKLAGYQYPISIIFDISDEEVYLISDIRLNGLGDSASSQRALSVSFYEKEKTPPANFNMTADVAALLQRITPDGYVKRTLVNEYGEEVDPRDFVAWTKGGTLYVLTPYHKYSPDPNAVSVSSNGHERLFEFSETPVITMKRNEQVVMMLVR